MINRRQVAPVALICDYPNIMVVPNNSPAHSVKDFIAHATANKGKFTFASSGHGGFEKRDCRNRAALQGRVGLKLTRDTNRFPI